MSSQFFHQIGEVGFLNANPCKLARATVSRVELREVDLRRDPALGIEPPDNHLVLFDGDTLHNLLALLNVQKGIDFLHISIMVPF